MEEKEQVRKGSGEGGRGERGKGGGGRRRRNRRRRISSVFLLLPEHFRAYLLHPFIQLHILHLLSYLLLFVTIRLTKNRSRRRRRFQMIINNLITDSSNQRFSPTPHNHVLFSHHPLRSMCTFCNRQRDSLNSLSSSAFSLPFFFSSPFLHFLFFSATFSNLSVHGLTNTIALLHFLFSSSFSTNPSPSHSPPPRRRRRSVPALLSLFYPHSFIGLTVIPPLPVPD
jgi:hypothetical protein